MTQGKEKIGPIHIAIPAKHLKAVEDLLLDLRRMEEEGIPVPRPTGPGVDPPEFAGEWPVTELRRLSAGTTKTNATIIAVLDVLARHPDRGLPTMRISVDTGLSRQSLKGAFANLTRLLKSHFDYDELGSPFNRQAIRMPRREEEVFYWLTAAQADRWTLARTAGLIDGR